MIQNFAGPVFTTDDTPTALLGIFAIAGIPIILLVISVVLLIRDIVQKKRRRSTLIFLGITIGVIFLVQVVFSGAI